MRRCWPMSPISSMPQAWVRSSPTNTSSRTPRFPRLRSRASTWSTARPECPSTTSRNTGATCMGRCAWQRRRCGATCRTIPGAPFTTAAGPLPTTAWRWPGSTTCRHCARQRRRRNSSACGPTWRTSLRATGLRPCWPRSTSFWRRTACHSSSRRRPLIGNSRMANEKTWETELAKLGAMQAQAREGGGSERLQKQREMGRLTARERIDYLLDPKSFVELNMLAEHQCHDFGMEKKTYLGDGVITGHGTIRGRRVFVYSEDETVLGGSVGKAHGTKIHTILRLARETGVPVICLNASGGARIQEGMDNVYGMTGMFYQNALNSGVVPQISAIMGACTGGNAYSSALCDFIVQVKKGSYIFITGPAVIKEVTGEEVSFEQLGGAAAHSAVSGVVHLTAEDDRECLDVIVRLLDYLPQNNQETPPKRPGTDAADREVPELTDIVPIKPSKTHDVKKIIRAIVDEGDFFEIQRSFARNLVIGFARLGGQVAGIVANNPQLDRKS